MKYKLRKLLRRLEFFFWRIKKRQSEYVIFSEHDVEMRMVADSHIAMFAVTRDFEPEERKFFVSKLDKVDCFINIGANVGFYVLLAAIKKKDIEIHAFEPMSLNMEKMRRNLELNSLEKRNNIHLYKIGAGDVSGEFDLFEDDGHLEKYIPYVIPHLEGHSFWYYGMVMHQMILGDRFKKGDYRITFQGHALKCDGVWRLFW